MRFILRWIPVMLFSIAIAVVVSFVPQMGGDPLAGVYTEHKHPIVTEVIKLSSHNLVDQFAGLTLYHKLERIDWNGITLQVEINVGEQLHTAQTVYEDLFTLSSFSFTQANNVETLLVRVLAGDERGNRWILMLHAGKSTWIANEAELEDKTAETIERYMKKHFQFTISPVWQKIEAL